MFRIFHFLSEAICCNLSIPEGGGGGEEGIDRRVDSCVRSEIYNIWPDIWRKKGRVYSY